MLLCLNGSSPMCNQVYRTRPDDNLATEAYLLAPMELEHRPCEAVLAGSCLWLRSTCYATGGLGAATVHVGFSRPQSSLVLSPMRKYNQTCSAALQRANPSTPPTVPVPCATRSTKPAQTTALSHLLAPMELEHRPCEAVSAGDCLWLHTIRYATGGLGAATVHVGFSRPQSSLVLSPRRKYNQTCFAALPRANPSTPPTVPVPCAARSTKPDQTTALPLKHTCLLLWS